jgi:hypothetical protein
MGLGLEKQKAHLLREGKRYNSLPKNVSILVFFVNPTTFDPSVEPFFRHFPKKTETPPLKKFKGLILGKSICMWFGQSKRQFHHIGFVSRCPGAIAAVLGQNTARMLATLPVRLDLERDKWQGIAGSFHTCPAYTPPRCLQGPVGYRRTRRGQYAQKTI